jgi:hypothetical protein
MIVVQDLTNRYIHIIRRQHLYNNSAKSNLMLP